MGRMGQSGVTQTQIPIFENDTIHDFQERLSWSESASDEPFWNEVYSIAFPTMIACVPLKGDNQNQRMGRDRLVYLENSKEIYIDEKKREKDYSDILLEYVSVDTTGAPGWMEKDLSIDYLAYAFIPSETVYLYPWDEIMAWLVEKVNPIHGDWFHNSVAYILVYAAFIGVKELRVFGADYASHNNGTVEAGHPNVAYWVGCLERAGLIVRPYANSQFLNAAQRDHIYGYRNDPRRVPFNRAKFQELINKGSSNG